MSKLTNTPQRHFYHFSLLGHKGSIKSQTPLYVFMVSGGFYREYCIRKYLLEYNSSGRKLQHQSRDGDNPARQGKGDTEDFNWDFRAFLDVLAPILSPSFTAVFNSRGAWPLHHLQHSWIQETAKAWHSQCWLFAAWYPCQFVPALKAPHLSLVWEFNSWTCLGFHLLSMGSVNANGTPLQLQSGHFPADNQKYAPA